MEIEKRLRPNLWKAIQAHYERQDFTECVRDAIFYMSELIREVSGIEDKDGSKLVESALLAKEPAILISKNETTTEKDFQQGIGFALKGIMQSVRNPISHEKKEYSQGDAEAIILYINFLMNQIDRSGGKNKIDNIMELLLDDDFTDTKEYAELLLKEVPAKKRYDLLLDLYNKRDKLPQSKLTFFIDALFNSLTKPAKNDFIQVVSSSLMKCKDDNALRMYCHYFMDGTYPNIDKLAQLRMENLFLRSIKAGKVTKEYNPITEEMIEHGNNEGSLAAWIVLKMDLLTNKESLVDALYNCIDMDCEHEAYVFKYFSPIIHGIAAEFTPWQISVYKRHLKNGDEFFFNLLHGSIEVWKDERYIALFGEEYTECKRIIGERKSVEENELQWQ